MLLAIDTSTRMVGLALYDGVKVLAESIWTGADYHTGELAPAIGEMLKRCGVEMNELEALGDPVDAAEQVLGVHLRRRRGLLERDRR